jgi:hypothetical protein
MMTYFRIFILIALLCASPAVAADALPQFTIAYFSGSCPDGWDNTSLASANGRFLIPTMLGGGVGAFSGEALASQQEPSHTHAKATGSISTSSKEYVLVDGCCNNSLGNSGTYTMSGSAQTASSGLPYIQYNACMKQVAPASKTSVPAEVTTFYLLPTCPTGWSPVNSAAGRYLVGLPANGAPSATFGGKALTPGENRTHSHTMNGTMNFPGHDIAGASGCCAHGYAGSGGTGFSGNTEVDTTQSYDSVTQAPYYTATFCRKN